MLTVNPAVADDLFAGAGGWDLAAELLGIRARGVEIMPEAIATREAAGLLTVHNDVWTFKRVLDAILDLDDPWWWLAYLLIASPPCQTFSAAGKGAGRKALNDVLRVIPHVADVGLGRLRKIGLAFGDERTALVLTPLWYALRYPYRALAWEQVPAVLPVWEACAVVLREHGWNVWVGLVHAEQHGVPQTRKRAVLIGSLDHEVGPPVPTHSRYHSRSPERLDEGVLPWVSMAEALGFGVALRPSPTVTGGGTETGGAEPIAKLARYTDREDWRERVVTGQNSATDRYGGTRRYDRATDVPAPTVTGQTRSWRFAGAGATSEQTAGQVPRESEQPAHTITGKGTAAWVLRGSPTDHATRRDLEQPAPTVLCSRVDNLTWEPTAAVEGDTSWVDRRPSPTIVGSFAPDVVAAPGYRKPGDPPRQKTPGSVRVTVDEAAVLQSFPSGFPWNGGPKDSSGKKYLQVGNAVPPLMGLAVLRVALAGVLASTLTDPGSGSPVPVTAATDRCRSFPEGASA